MDAIIHGLLSEQGAEHLTYQNLTRKAVKHVLLQEESLSNNAKSFWYDILLHLLHLRGFIFEQTS